MKIAEFHVKRPENMRYKTVGDWYLKHDEETNTGILVIETADLGDHGKNYLILLHEFVEFILCNAAGITQDEVDEFDFENQDEQSAEVELGELEDCPYHSQHMIADGMERIAASVMEIPWADYVSKVDEVYDRVDEAISEKQNAEEEVDSRE